MTRSGKPGPCNAPDRFLLGLAHGGGAGFDLVHARIGKRAGDIEFLRCRERDAGRLFAVPQRRIVDRDAPAEAPPLKKRRRLSAAVIVRGIALAGALRS